MALCPSFCLQFLTSCTVIDNIAKELEKVNGSKTITPPFKFAVSQAPSLAFFKTFYERLDTLLSLENPPKQPSAENLHTTPPTQTALPTAVFATPPPSTNPVDPQYSSTSDATSASYVTSASGESKDEHSTDSFANDFVCATLNLLEEPLEQMAWYGARGSKLKAMCLPQCYRANFRGKQKMVFKSGKVEITAWSDGGLSLQPIPGRSGFHPVFPIEVFLLRRCR